MDLIVIVTGARDFPYPRVVHAQLDVIRIQRGRFLLFHGACTPRGSSEMTGADRYADDWGKAEPGIEVKPFPADWITFGNAAGPIRNTEMVNTALSLLPADQILGLAFPGPRSRGTWDCVKKMNAAHITCDEWDVRRSREWLENAGQR